MINDLLKDNCYFIYSKEVELLNLVVNLFCDNSKNKFHTSIYTEEFLTKTKEKYCFLSEILAPLNVKGLEIFEFLLYDNTLTLLSSLDSYEDYVLSLDNETFFYYFFGRNVSRDMIQLALLSDEGIDNIYKSCNYICSSYLALINLFRSKEKFIHDFIACAKEFNTKDLDNVIALYEPKLKDSMMMLTDGLSKDTPLEFSQKLMGKTFHNRGPYQKFYFIPSIFFAYRRIRYFHDDQIMIYPLLEHYFSSKNTVKILKVIADETRFHLLELLSQKGPMIGKDLSKELNVATSTISHHIEQLKGIGILNEERDKNSKYYSVNSNTVDELLSHLANQLKSK